MARVGDRGLQRQLGVTVQANAKEIVAFRTVHVARVVGLAREGCLPAAPSQYPPEAVSTMRDDQRWLNILLATEPSGTCVPSAAIAAYKRAVSLVPSA